jgi:hypothetical protein
MIMYLVMSLIYPGVCTGVLFRFSVLVILRSWDKSQFLFILDVFNSATENIVQIIDDIIDKWNLTKFSNTMFWYISMF